MKLHLFRGDDLTEVVFQNRNKAYGAYALRTGYHRTLNRSMAITLSAFGLFAGALILWQHATRTPVVENPVHREPRTIVDIFVVPQEKRAEAKTAVRVPEAPPAERVDAGYTVVDRVIPEPAPPAGATGDLAGPVASAGASDGSTAGTEPAGSSAGLETLGSSLPMESAAVDLAPVFPGGMENFYKYLRKRITLTDEALRAGLSGRIYLDFVVGADGRVTGVHVLKGVGYGMDEQVARILTQSPSWTPGKYGGQDVATILRLPVFLNTIQ